MADPLFNMSSFYALLASNRPEEVMAQLTPTASSDPRVRSYIEEMLKTEEGREVLMRHPDLLQSRGIPNSSREPSDTEMLETPGTDAMDDGEGSVNR